MKVSISKIKLVRMKKGLRQWDVAVKAGVSESYISKIETGRVKPDRALLVKLSVILDWPMLDLEGEP